MAYPPVMPLVEVLWVDAYSRNAYTSAAELDEWLDDEANACNRTVGWLYREDSALVAIVQNVTPWEQYDNIMRIPKGMVRDIRVIQAVTVEVADAPEGAPQHAP